MFRVCVPVEVNIKFSFIDFEKKRTSAVTQDDAIHWYDPYKDEMFL